MKFIKAYIMSNPVFKGCSNNGISDKFTEVYVQCEKGWIDFDNPPENAVKIIKRSLFGRVIYHAEPISKPDPTCVGWMSGGAYVASSDSRFAELCDGNYIAISLHDRQETAGQYYDLSR